MTEEILLHQYGGSPFSEKIRKLLAFKRIRWRSVEQPIVAPKPKLTPLTGGYRRIPVLQIGADIYCDTALIARVLEERKPEPSCYPGGHVGACEIIAHWADHWLFMAAVPPAIVTLLSALPPEFMRDRQAMSPAFTVENLEASLPD
ncbi:MAG: glutathione S-transferase N-terminal domain-containing protein, partial [Candidatus Binatia bacterium]